MDASESKGYSVKYDGVLGVVVALVYGKALHSDHIAAREEAKCICRDKQCLKLLVDLRRLDTENSTSLDCFMFGRTMANAMSGLRVAFVIPSDNKAINDLRFTLKVGEHPDILCAEFTSNDVAIDWLQKGK
jgi:hypothetical protein